MRTPALLPLPLLAAVVAQGAVRGSIPLGLDAYRPIPEDNPLTPAKIALGRKLFFDRRLSRDQSLSCSTCHQPRRSFTDGRPVAVGIEGRTGARNVPTLINRVYGKSHFLDGRAESLERQAIEPIQNPKEMDMTLEEVVARLRRDRRTSNITSEELARALASYVRTILSGNAPIDRYMNGEREALSEEARRGLNLFRGKANCTACHVGPNFSDEGFHNSGVAWRDGQWLDPGRFVVTGKEADRGAFKTPTLREIARTAPYMHNGSLATLEEVIEFYNRGGNRNPYLDPELRPLNLSAEEKAALLAFLQSLSGQIQEGMLN